MPWLKLDGINADLLIFPNCSQLLLLWLFFRIVRKDWILSTVLQIYYISLGFWPLISHNVLTCPSWHSIATWSTKGDHSELGMICFCFPATPKEALSKLCDTWMRENKLPFNPDTRLLLSVESWFRIKVQTAMHSSERNIYTVFTLKMQLDLHLSPNLQESCEACIIGCWGFVARTLSSIIRSGDIDLFGNRAFKNYLSSFQETENL